MKKQNENIGMGKMPLNSDNFTVEFAGESWDIGFMGFEGETFYYHLYSKDGTFKAMVPAGVVNEPKR